MGKAAAKSKELKAAMLRGQEQAEGSFWLWKPGERAWEKGQGEELSGHEPVNMSSFKDGKHLAQGNMTKP